MRYAYRIIEQICSIFRYKCFIFKCYLCLQCKKENITIYISLIYKNTRIRSHTTLNNDYRIFCANNLDTLCGYVQLCRTAKIAFRSSLITDDTNLIEISYKTLQINILINARNVHCSI